MALVFPRPSDEISSSEKAIILLEVILPTSWSTFSTNMLWATYTSFSTFIIALRWGSEFIRRANRKIRAGSLLSCSTTLYSLCLINFKNSETSFSVIGPLIKSGLVSNSFDLGSSFIRFYGVILIELVHNISHFELCLQYPKCWRQQVHSHNYNDNSMVPFCCLCIKTGTKLSQLALVDAHLCEPQVPDHLLRRSLKAWAFFLKIPYKFCISGHIDWSFHYPFKKFKFPWIHHLL